MLKPNHCTITRDGVLYFTKGYHDQIATLFNEGDYFVVLTNKDKTKLQIRKADSTSSYKVRKDDLVFRFQTSRIMDKLKVAYYDTLQYPFIITKDAIQLDLTKGSDRYEILTVRYETDKSTSEF